MYTYTPVYQYANIAHSRVGPFLWDQRARANGLMLTVTARHVVWPADLYCTAGLYKLILINPKTINVLFLIVTH